MHCKLRVQCANHKRVYNHQRCIDIYIAEMINLLLQPIKYSREINSWHSHAERRLDKMTKTMA